MAPDNVQVNLIAQNYVENPVYYPPELRANERFQASLKRQVPLGRLATAEVAVRRQSPRTRKAWPSLSRGTRPSSAARPTRLCHLPAPLCPHATLTREATNQCE